MNAHEDKIEKLYCLAQDRFHQQDLSEAIDSLKALLALNFRHLDAHFLLALIYQQDQSYELSNQHFRICLKEDYKSNEIYKLIAFNSKQLALYKNALHELQKHLHINPNDDDAYALMGDIYRLQGEDNFAAKVYLEAIALNPKNPSYYLKLSHVFQMQNKASEAILEVQKAIALDHNYHEAHFFLATLYAQQEKFQEAVNAYQKAISIHNTIALYHHNLALALQELHAFKEASQAQKNALALEPLNPHYQKSLTQEL